MSDFEYLLSTIDKIKGVGKKTLSSFNKKKIFTIFDLLWHLPISKIETAEDTEIEDLQVGKIYNITRMRICHIEKSILAKIKKRVHMHSPYN